MRTSYLLYDRGMGHQFDQLAQVQLQSVFPGPGTTNEQFFLNSLKRTLAFLTHKGQPPIYLVR